MFVFGSVLFSYRFSVATGGEANRSPNFSANWSAAAPLCVGGVFHCLTIFRKARLTVSGSAAWATAEARLNQFFFALSFVGDGRLNKRCPTCGCCSGVNAACRAHRRQSISPSAPPHARAPPAAWRRWLWACWCGRHQGRGGSFSCRSHCYRPHKHWWAGRWCR